MGTPSIWNKLSNWQRFIAMSIGTTAAGWPAGKLLDVLANNFSFLGFLSVIAQTIFAIIGSPITIAFMVGALLAGFGPTLWTYFRKVGTGGIIGIFTSIVFLGSLGFFGWMVASSIYSGIFERPRFYAPPENLKFGADKKPRVFSTWALRDFTRPYNDKTEFAATRSVESEVGKWVAVTGIISDVEPDIMNGGLRVSLSARFTGYASLEFDRKWNGIISELKKGVQLHAICRFRTATPSGVHLDYCQPVSPSG